MHRQIERLFFTDDVVWQLQHNFAAPDTFTWFQDEAVSELRLRITATKRTWYFYKTTGGRSRSLKLGDFPRMAARDARAVIEPMLKSAQFGEDPKQSRPRALLKRLPDYGDVFRAYLHDYLKVHKAKKAWTEAEQSFRRCHKHFANVRVNEISRTDVQQWINTMGEEQGPAAANREFNIFRAVINYGEKMQLYKLEINPTDYIKTFPEVRRDRYLSADETDRLYKVLEQRPSHQRDIVMLALYTAARKGNILAAEWKEIDFVQRIWKIPATKSKNRKPLVLPLTDDAVRLLDLRKNEVGDSPWVFPSLGDNYVWGSTISRSGHIQNFDSAWREIKKLSGLEDFHFHDLRHSVASWLGSSGVNAFTIMQVLGHSSIVTTNRYTHLNQDVGRAALDSVRLNLGEISPPDALVTAEGLGLSSLVSFASYVERKANRK